MSTRAWLRDDYYATLGVGPGATAEEIGRAFRALAKDLHPDRAAGTGERFKALTSAYGVLGNPARRRAYDELRRTGTAPAAGPSGATPGATVTGLGRACPPPLSVRFLATRRRGRWSLWSGAVLLVAGLVGVGVVVTIQRHERARRDHTVAVSATRLVTGDGSLLAFTTRDGMSVRVPEPGGQGGTAGGARVQIRYDPAHPTRVFEDEDTTARDIMFWIVAVKLAVSGALFAGLGVRRLRYA